ncbi:MAG: transporter substrate-binding domain-containing protein [Anaerovoracaceae bacterium]
MKRNIGLILSGVFVLVFFGFSMNTMIKYNLDWLDYIKYNFGLTAAEQKYCKETEIVCGLQTDHTPLAFIDIENQKSGMLVDFISQLSIEAENEMSIRMFPKEENSRAISKDVQVVIMEKSREALKRYALTEPIYILHGKILVRESEQYNNIKELTDVKIAIDISDGIEKDLKGFYAGDDSVKIVYVKDLQEGLRLLENNTVQAIAGDETKLSYILNESRNDINRYKFLGYAFYRKELCFALDKKNEQLKSVLEKSILSMKQKELIYQTQRKWFGSVQPAAVDIKQLNYIYKMIFVVIGITVTLLSWNYLTSRKVAIKTRELSESKEELRVILDSLDRGLIFVNEQGKIVEGNDAIKNFIGTEKNQIIGENINELPSLEPYISNPEGKIFKLGNKYYATQKISFDEGEKKLIIIEDNTKRYINEIQNRQEAKMVAVGQLSAGLAHEIRNPLGLIKSYIFLIKQSCQGSDGEHAIKVINESINRINMLIENLLKFSRLSNDENKEINIEELVESFVVLEAKNLKNNKISINYNIDKKQTGNILINEEILKMIFVNLLNNSIDAFDGITREKYININISVNKTIMSIIFEDNGCGIPSDKISEVFNPFYSSKETGTGLGLYVISSQLEQIGGNIRAERNVGAGTSFYIEMPIGGGKYE